MKLRPLNKKIKAREQFYLDSAQRINDRFKQEVKRLDDFRCFAVCEIFKLKDKDRTLMKYKKEKYDALHAAGETGGKS